MITIAKRSTSSRRTQKHWGCSSKLSRSTRVHLRIISTKSESTTSHAWWSPRSLPPSSTTSSRLYAWKRHGKRHNSLSVVFCELLTSLRVAKLVPPRRRSISLTGSSWWTCKILLSGRRSNEKSTRFVRRHGLRKLAGRPHIKRSFDAKKSSISSPGGNRGSLYTTRCSGSSAIGSIDTPSTSSRHSLYSGCSSSRKLA